MIDRPVEENDPALVRLVDASAPFRAASRAGEYLVAAWQWSALARMMRAWLALPLDRRIRLASIVVIVAILTHIALTGFNAPEPTWWARATWVAVVMVTMLAGFGARGIAAAWTAWVEHRHSRGRVNA